MKRLFMQQIALLCAIILTVGSAPQIPASADSKSHEPVTADETKELYLGDFNGDDALSINDAVLLSRFLVEDDTLNAVVYPEAGDMDSDGIYTVADISLMLKQLYDIYDTSAELPDKLGNIYTIHDEMPVSDEATAREAIVQAADELGISVSETAEEFVLKDVFSNTNHTFYDMQQQYQGIDVYGGSLRLAVDEDGKCDCIINGYAELPEQVDTSAELTPEQVQDKLMENTDHGTVLSCEHQKTWLNSETGKLMYEFNAYVKAEEYFVLDSVFADAESAEVIARYENQSGAGENEEISVSRLYTEDDMNVVLNMAPEADGSYRFEDYTRRFSIYDAENKVFDFDKTKYGKNAIEFPEVRSNEFSAETASQKDALKLMAYMSNAYDYYHDKLGYDKTIAICGIINDKGAEGQFANSGWIASFTDGTDIYHISASSAAYIKPDIITHEFTHNIVKSISDVPYGQSSVSVAIHEAYADVMAMCITKDADWMILENDTSYCRDMKNISIKDFGSVTLFKTIDLIGDYQLNAGYSYSLYFSNVAYQTYDMYTSKKLNLSSDEAFSRIAELWYDSMAYFQPNKSPFKTTDDSFVYALETAETELNYTDEERLMIRGFMIKNGLRMPDLQILDDTKKKVPSAPLDLRKKHNEQTETTTSAATTETTTTTTATTPELPPAEGKRVKQIVKTNRGQNIVLAEDGSLYIWGYFVSFDGKSGASTARPRKVLENVRYVSDSPSDRCAAITEDNRLYTWGSGFLGNGKTAQVIDPVMIMENVKDVVMGTHTGAAITEDGSLYLWGKNDCGQIGIGSTEDQLVPVKILDNVKTVSLSIDTSAAITEDGSLYVWGRNNNYGGNYASEEYEIQLVPLKVMEHVKAVSIGTRNTAAITENGDLYTFGYGYLGNGEYTQEKSDPVKILENVKSVSHNQYEWDSFWTAVTEDGDLYTWGEYPVKITEEVIDVSRDTASSLYVITKDGDLYLWKDLSVDHSSEINPPVRVMRNVKAVSSKDYLAAAITSDGRVYSWDRNPWNTNKQSDETDITPELKMGGAKTVYVSGSIFVITEEGYLYSWGSNADPTQIVIPFDKAS